MKIPQFEQSTRLKLTYYYEIWTSNGHEYKMEIYCAPEHGCSLQISCSMSFSQQKVKWMYALRRRICQYIHIISSNWLLTITSTQIYHHEQTHEPIVNQLFSSDCYCCWWNSFAGSSRCHRKPFNLNVFITCVLCGLQTSTLVKMGRLLKSFCKVPDKRMKVFYISSKQYWN